MRAADMVDVEVDGGSLRVARWDGSPGTPAVVAAHGITASHLAWQAVADALGGRVTLLAPDLRGRGVSAGLPGPWGMDRHARDLLAIADAQGVDQVVVAGHSMGAYVATALAARAPTRVRAAVLVEGGLPLPPPAGVDPDTVLAAVLGPALARLRETFDSREAVREFWRAHPAFAHAGCWDERIAAYADYDVAATSDGLRSRVREDAVRADYADMLAGAVDPASIPVPLRLVRATRGLLNQPEPFLPEALVERYTSALPAMVCEQVDANHYTVVMCDPGAQRVAAHLLAAAQLP